MIFAASDIVTSMKTGAALTDNNVSCCNYFATETLDTESFGVGVASVSCTASSFLVSHCKSPCRLSGNASNLDFRIVLAVPHLFHVVFAPSEFNDSDFFVTALGYYRSGDLGALKEGLANLHVLSGLNHQYLVKLDVIALT